MLIIEKFVQSSSVGKDGVGEWVNQKLPQLFPPNVVKEVDGNIYKTISALKELAMTTHRGYFFRIQNEDNGYEYYHYPMNGGSSNLGDPYFICITEKVYDIHPSMYLELENLPDDIARYYKGEVFEEELYSSRMIDSVEDVQVIAFWGKYTRRDMESLAMRLYSCGLKLTHADGMWIIH